MSKKRSKEYVYRNEEILGKIRDRIILVEQTYKEVLTIKEVIDEALKREIKSWKPLIQKGG